jgi:hypothetical protein
MIALGRPEALPFLLLYPSLAPDMVRIEKLRVWGVVEEREEQRDRAFCHRGLESSSALPIGLLSVDREKKKSSGIHAQNY